jgi:hypothetical protein
MNNPGTPGTPGTSGTNGTSMGGGSGTPSGGAGH